MTSSARERRAQRAAHRAALSAEDRQIREQMITVQSGAPCSDAEGEAEEKEKDGRGVLAAESHDGALFNAPGRCQHYLQPSPRTDATMAEHAAVAAPTCAPLITAGSARHGGGSSGGLPPWRSAMRPWLAPTQLGAAVRRLTLALAFASADAGGTASPLALLQEQRLLAEIAAHVHAAVRAALPLPHVRALCMGDGPMTYASARPDAPAALDQQTAVSVASTVDEVPENTACAPAGAGICVARMLGDGSDRRGPGAVLQRDGTRDGTGSSEAFWCAASCAPHAWIPPPQQRQDRSLPVLV